MDFYNERKASAQIELDKLTRRHTIVSFSRLVIALIFLTATYFVFKLENTLLLYIVMIFCAVEFVLLMRRHNKLDSLKKRAAELVKINQEEIDYLNGKSLSFPNGNQFVDHDHPYTHDLDIFGERSLFHNINRTQTYKGAEKLASLLKNKLPDSEILANQEAVNEMSKKPEFRQEIMALARVDKDSQNVYDKLIAWAESPVYNQPFLVRIIAILIPVLLFGCIVLYLFTNEVKFANAAGWLFGFNLAFILNRLKYIKNELKDGADIDKVLLQYGLIIGQIEKEDFTSIRLKSLQQDLLNNGAPASANIKKLARLFSALDSSNNLFGAALFNGFLLYHIHILNGLNNWKSKNALSIARWLDVIADVEVQATFGNLYFNNPEFNFPLINQQNVIDFSNVAHPLLNKKGRVGNSIDFNNGYIILTGSNMSGKSTFLRCLGINMVLAGVGAPVCAESANIHPLPVLVSMRLTDSLSDSESYFFAEVKRLKFVMDELAEQSAFVLLDEILRGTNSDDKRTGTIKVIRRLVKLKAIGAIATHDIEVCALTKDYPAQLTNKCFEAKIEDDELYFDYLLRDGICRNKSATFLMEKMGVI